jgi:7-keto-8-aminopelargonate synthetase-like enzyme
MPILYVYDADTREVLAKITGEQGACERIATERFGDTDIFAATYTPAFGSSGGLIETEYCEEIEA